MPRIPYLALLVAAAGLAQPPLPPSVPGPGPAAAPRSPELEARLDEALAARRTGTDLRTRHRLDDGRPRYVNRLVLEDSTYLQQHAYNPVDWYPWGPEAFERARREGRPIFLSIGYSTCHWCHVMERESFDDEDIARRLNAAFVCIKVDRERRPDIDEIYMTAVQMTSGHGGWPLSTFLTPDGKPFFGGTYFPPDRFVELLERVGELWQTRRADLERDAQRVSGAVSELVAARTAVAELTDDVLQEAVRQLLERHDSALGGFSPAPKFPQETHHLLLLQRARRGLAAGDDPLAEPSQAATETSLLAMARGGIYDQIAGGFHRYSTDDRWLVPHFEKMLYNQALLTRAYLEAYRQTGRALYLRVARQTLDYVHREMTASGGGFYSATDADSDGVEGAFFVWTPDELRQVLGPELSQLAAEVFGVTAEGNFAGKNILYLPRPLGEVARRRSQPLDVLLARVDSIRGLLLEARESRTKPLRDDKIITAWNGMMIVALAEAGQQLDEPVYLGDALRAAEFLWHRRPVTEDGIGLWRIHLHDSSSVSALLDDYAAFGEGLLALFDATGDGLWLERASKVADALLERFWDEQNGGFFMTELPGDDALFTRPKSPADGAVPSGNSMACRFLVRLAARTGEPRYRQHVEATFASFAGSLTRAPAAFSYMLLALDELRHGEAGPREHAAGGKVRVVGSVTATPERGRLLQVRLAIAPGWHVNAHRPLQEQLVPTVLELAPSRSWTLDSIDYPEPTEVRLAFQQEPLAVYRDSAEVTAALQRSEGTAAERLIAALLQIQACDDRACLRPEILQLELAVP